MDLRTIGVIGGMSWESTAVYYRLLNEFVRDRLGGLHSARVIIHSVDFADVARCQAEGDWASARALVIQCASDLKRAGADFIVLATNTMHKVADGIEEVVGVPLLHIVDATAAALRSPGCRRPLLLGTRFTMEDGFVTDRLRAYDMDPVIPDQAGVDEVHRIIYEELCRGVINPCAKAACIDVIDRARSMGIDSIILGCTELGLILSQADADEIVVDTTRAHVEAAVELALAVQPAHGLAVPLRAGQEGSTDMVSRWRLQNMTEAERLLELGPPRPRSVLP